jgi:uncharacterized protein (TIGR03437 family)
MVRVRTRRTILFAILSSSYSFGQGGMSLVGVGYKNPQTMYITAGQVTTLLISGTNTILPPGSSMQRATQLPLPVSLAGFSAAISQYAADGGMVVKSEALPLLEVNQINNCANAATPPPRECILTELTVQIPSDLLYDYDHTGTFSYTTAVTITDGAGTSQSFNVLFVPQNVHIMTTCDITLPAPVVIMSSSAGCSNEVTHLDGEQVTSSSPAQPGEVLVMYALGLGIHANPGGGALGYALAFAYSGGATQSPQVTPVSPPNPSFVGPVPGQVGLYQVNFTVPSSNGPVSGCDVPDGANLRVILSTSQSLSPSFDTARICVNTTTN